MIRVGYTIRKLSYAWQNIDDALVTKGDDDSFASLNKQPQGSDYSVIAEIWNPDGQPYSQSVFDDMESAQSWAENQMNNATKNGWEQGGASPDAISPDEPQMDMSQEDMPGFDGGMNGQEGPDGPTGDEEENPEDGEEGEDGKPSPDEIV
jgi:hypothetical protein